MVLVKHLIIFTKQKCIYEYRKALVVCDQGKLQYRSGKKINLW